MLDVSCLHSFGSYDCLPSRKSKAELLEHLSNAISFAKQDNVQRDNSRFCAVDGEGIPGLWYTVVELPETTVKQSCCILGMYLVPNRICASDMHQETLRCIAQAVINLNKNNLNHSGWMTVTEWSNYKAKTKEEMIEVLEEAYKIMEGCPEVVEPLVTV